MSLVLSGVIWAFTAPLGTIRTGVEGFAPFDEVQRRSEYVSVIALSLPLLWRGRIECRKIRKSFDFLVDFWGGSF